MMKLEKIIDLFMFRESAEDDDYNTKPQITTGAIVWGVIMRSALIITLMLLLNEQLHLRNYWYFSLFTLWIFVAYPAYRQYRRFNERMDSFEEETLCGTCIHFDRGGQLCKIYDEHVSKNYIPCDGMDWQPKNYDEE